MIAGQLIAALVGFAALAVGGPGIRTAAAAGGLALAAMLVLRAAHSPAAATAVIVGATAPPAGRFLVLLAAATAILVATGVLGARIEGKKYPLYCGSMSMQVDLPETGTMIFTADAIFMGASYGPPTVPGSIVNNLEQFYASVEKLRGIATKTSATLVFGHDPEQMKQLRVAPAGSYR